MVEVAAFYKFVSLQGLDFVVLRSSLLALMEKVGIKGTIILAPDGVNSTIAGLGRGSTSHILNKLRTIAGLESLQPQLSYAEKMPFAKAKVKLKPEILTFKEPTLPTIAQLTGAFVAPKEWNELITDPQVTLLDTRNTYETEVGTFQNAIDPQIETFVEFKDFVKKLDPAKHKKIAMFCTGGIRCERASNYMLSKGFAEVYQLQGGITNYFRCVNEDASLWTGSCFIFDERGALDHDLNQACD